MATSLEARLTKKVPFVLRDVDPTAADYHFEPPYLWLNRENETVFWLVDVTGEVATWTSAPFADDSIKDYHIDWGLGAGQVNSEDVPDHNGHSIHDTFTDIINRGKSTVSTITLTGGLGISWIEFEIFDVGVGEFATISAGSGSLTDNSLNYLKWVSGTTATISTSSCSGDEIVLAIFSVYDGVISGYRETSLIHDTVANTRRGLRACFPNRILSGMSVYEDTDVTNDLDVMMDAGVLWKDGIEEKTPIEIKSRNTAMVRHFKTAGAWDSDTNTEIDVANYNNGTNLAAIPNHKYSKSLFIFMNGKIGWVYPTEYFTVEADAIKAALPIVPPGLQGVPILTAIVHKEGDTNFTDTIWQDVRPGIGQKSFSGVTDHGSLSGLADDDHPQYIQLSEVLAWGTL